MGWGIVLQEQHSYVFRRHLNWEAEGEETQFPYFPNPFFCLCHSCCFHRVSFYPLEAHFSGEKGFFRRQFRLGVKLGHRYQPSSGASAFPIDHRGAQRAPSSLDWSYLVKMTFVPSLLAALKPPRVHFQSPGPTGYFIFLLPPSPVLSS